jgi:glycine hydroxymethyltransferase
MVTSGLRIGTPALATRGFTDVDFVEVADVIAAALTAPVGDLDPSLAASLRSRVSALADKHPLYPGL